MPQTILATEEVAIDSLVPFPGNPRRHDLGALIHSLEQHGQYKPLVVQRRNRQVLAGNGTLDGMLALGYVTCYVAFVDVSDEDAKRIVAIDNRVGDLGGYDNALLSNLLSSLDGLQGTGYDEKALDDLLSSLEQEVQLQEQTGEWDYATPNRGPGAGTANPVALREVLLVFTPPDQERFRQFALQIQMHYKLTSTSATILFALEATAQALPKAGA